MKKNSTQYWIIIILITISSSLFSQIYAPEGLNMPGEWNTWINPPTNNLAFASSTQVTDGRVELIEVGTQRWQTIFQVAAAGGDLTEGTYNWLFTSGPETDAFANKWGDVTVTLNTLQDYTYQGTGDNNITLSNDHWYTMVWEDTGYDNTRAIFMETTNEPVEIQTVTTPTSVIPDEVVIVNITTNNILSPEELIYLRYTTDNWTTSSLVDMIMNGTDGTASIPGQTDGTTVNYYVFSTTVSGLTGDYDLYTIELNNNDGVNYEYTVIDNSPAVIDWANLQYPEAGTIMTGDSYDVYSQVYIEGITDQTGQGTDVQAWIGYSLIDTDPATWTDWTPSTYNSDVGDNDEYLADLGIAIPADGVYYYASRFQYLAQDFVYGGFSSAGGGFWDGTTNVSGILTVSGTPPDPEIGWANLQHPDSGIIEIGQEYLVYSQAWIENITGQATPAENLQSWIGYSMSNSDPSTWTNWIPADYFGVSASNDEFMADLGSQLTLEGTYYYASRFQYIDQDFVYGGFSPDGGGFWDGTTNISGVLTVTNELITYPVTFTATDATGLYSNIKFKGSMTNWETIDMEQVGNTWSVTLDLLPGNYEWGVIEDDGTPDGIWLIIGPNLVVDILNNGQIEGETSYTITYVGIEENAFAVNLYPNPVIDQLKIDMSMYSNNTFVDIFNSVGTKVSSIQTTSSQNKIDMTHMTPGIYLISVRNNNQQIFKKIVKL